ncbi:MAG: helix-turn-helix domain-containing protein [Betaproteobacteria bacterium]|nr:helix-turn-helix domain-containing protein [Betaproteobacteria bacterium]
MKTSDAIAYFGSKSKLAAALGIKLPSVYGWGEYVPRQRQYEIERITNGVLAAQWPANGKKAA